MAKTKSATLCVSCQDPRRMAMRSLGAIVGRKIKYYDYHALSEADQKKYYHGAQALLRDEVLQNEVKNFVAEMIEYIVSIVDNKERQEMLRYSVDGVQALMERLEEIEEPGTNKKPDSFDPYEIG